MSIENMFSYQIANELIRRGIEAEKRKDMVNANVLYAAARLVTASSYGPDMPSSATLCLNDAIELIKYAISQSDIIGGSKRSDVKDAIDSLFRKE